MKIEKKKIGPTHYNEVAHRKWSDSLFSTQQHGHANKGRFGMHDRVLHAAELMNKTRKDNMPAPGCYDDPRTLKPKQFKFSSSVKSPSFIDNAIHHSN